MKRCCRTCEYWGEEEYPEGPRQCEWPEPVGIPFWAHIDRGRDHDDATSANEGTNCKAWRPAPNGESSSETV